MRATDPTVASYISENQKADTPTGQRTLCEVPPSNHPTAMRPNNSRHKLILLGEDGRRRESQPPQLLPKFQKEEREELKSRGKLLYPQDDIRGDK